ncbi:MAG: hypothetical protein RR358_05950 [Cetobacterium sp.]
MIKKHMVLITGSIIALPFSVVGLPLMCFLVIFIALAITIIKLPHYNYAPTERRERKKLTEFEEYQLFKIVNKRR